MMFSCGEDVLPLPVQDELMGPLSRGVDHRDERPVGDVEGRHHRIPAPREDRLLVDADDRPDGEVGIDQGRAVQRIRRDEILFPALAEETTASCSSEAYSRTKPENWSWFFRISSELRSSES